MTTRAAFLALSSCVLIACSGGGDGGSSSSSSSGFVGTSSSGGSSSGGSKEGKVFTTTTPAALSAYCTGQTLVSLKVLTSIGGQSWVGASDTVAIGSTIYLGHDFNDWNGFAILDDGQPAILHDETTLSSLVEGKHYTGSCTAPASTTERRAVLLRDAHFFASEDLSGTACTLPIGTEIVGYTYASKAYKKGSLSADAVKSTCGFDPGFSSDVAFAPLVKK